MGRELLLRVVVPVGIRSFRGIDRKRESSVELKCCCPLSVLLQERR